MKIGSVVRLRSGGPRMVILSKVQTSSWESDPDFVKWRCAWIDAKCKAHESVFPEDGLIEVPLDDAFLRANMNRWGG